MALNDPLQSENFSLRQQLETLLHEARQNEDKMRRFDQLERKLIAASSLLELVRLLLSEYKLAFGIDHVTLALVDKDYEATRILECAHGIDSDFSGLTLLQSSVPLEILYGNARRPCLGVYEAQQHQTLFNDAHASISSVALLPLTRQGELIGSLNFGSTNPDRYITGWGTDFLERLAEVVAICLESALAQERLKLIGLTDVLTGVQNRRYFEHRCHVEISQARRYKHPLACMFLDIDKFKRINDSYGHQSGDEVLKSVALAIQSQLRSGDTIARYGGEEFVVLLPQAELHHAQQIAERIRCSIAEKSLQALGGQTIKLTISIGLSMLPVEDLVGEDKQLAERLVASADKALYEAKHRGRNQVVCACSQPSGQAKLTPWGRIHGLFSS
ncbi:sensor domain-containing diguanylate cyclase [Propionivibrio sp.]|uniref:GGDEF domain-containing protein n=1 Tax=Propionivibrio sp. TaxID=2212460 RepID=UPI0025CDCE50|nr:sensor domain-containing diguanylate cyclase [Propionivibrio sp.]MBK7355046.1 sensor domain-containing diguanylate cyclase [Propionivibrio sp.]MBK8402416.1 sensor domain-containing diguanylate cyclase [Propionivibrio sp.]MBK8743570.1 sensor domain-containing diguanylate cyclase [Propionivibrio sp.]MBK8892874.1 sensor domain-containing diguanylate cyclase [Propionivibrio sp.]MBL0206463.1 sensor domain-containing diguanylate cyclase [Propionivibrio sp.]